MTTASHAFHRRRPIIHIPKDIQIPVIVFSLQAVLLIGSALVFIVLIPR
jgi:hypothetical protein